MRLWYLSHRQPAKAQASLHICTVSPEPLLFAHMKCGSRWRVLPKIKYLAPLDGCACVLKNDFTEDKKYHNLMSWLKCSQNTNLKRSLFRICSNSHRCQLTDGPRQANLVLNRLCEQRRFRRACASAQSRQNLRYSLIQAVSQEGPSDRKPDPWPRWMAGHVQLKFVITECSKTQIRLMRPRLYLSCKIESYTECLSELIRLLLVLIIQSFQVSTTLHGILTWR